MIELYRQVNGMSVHCYGWCCCRNQVLMQTR